MNTETETFIEAPKSNNNSAGSVRDSSLWKLQCFFLVAGGFFAVLSFIVALVSLTAHQNQCVKVNVEPGSRVGEIALCRIGTRSAADKPVADEVIMLLRGSSSESVAGWDDDKVWTFAIGHAGLNIEYLDEESGEIRGFDVDFVNAVCKYANKNCRVVHDVIERCWNSEAGDVARGGEGLFGRFYDACAAWMQSYERARVFQFTDPWSNPAGAVLYVKKGNPRQFNWQDLTTSTVGFIDGLVYNENCLARDGRIKGNRLQANQIKHYKSRDALISGAINGEVDAIFDTRVGYDHIDELEKASDDITVCHIAGMSIMVLKDSRLPEWWNPAQKALMKTPEYRRICDDLKIKHGHWPGPSPEQYCLNYN